MQIVKLNLIPGGVLPVCFASQNDTGRVIRFMLFEGENVFTLSGAESIELRLKKPDGSELVESVTNTGADYVEVVTTADTCDTAGASVGEIAITDGGDVIGSANFGLFVEADAFDGGVITTQTASGAIATFETNIETAFASLTAEINPVQSGTGTPSPQNVRPISGFSALNVTRTGKNFAQTSLTGINIDSSGILVPYATFDMVIAPVKAGQTYTATNNESNQFICGFFASLPSQGSQSYNNSRVVQSSKTITAPIDGYIAFRVPTGFANYQLELGNQASDYEPYNGQTATVNFGQTVYGGVADVTNGKVTNKYVAVKISDITWTASGDFFYSSLPLKKVGNTTFLCECLRVVDVASVSAMVNGDIKGHPSNTNMYIKNTDWASATDLYNAIGNYYIVYELATPTEITTTPENLTAISGENNVYGDTNGDTEVEYYIEV